MLIKRYQELQVKKYLNFLGSEDNILQVSRLTIEGEHIIMLVVHHDEIELIPVMNAPYSAHSIKLPLNQIAICMPYHKYGLNLGVRFVTF